MEEETLNWKALEERVADLDTRRLAWKFSPQNPLATLEQEILQVLEELIKIYPDATDKERIAIRTLMKDHSSVAMYLQAVATRDIKRFRSEIEPNRLFSALIAVSMANSDFGDFRDLLVLLGEFWLLGARNEIDPAPYFQQVAELSDLSNSLQCGTSMRNVLADFHTYAHFKEAVEPYLPIDEETKTRLRSWLVGETCSKVESPNGVPLITLGAFTIWIPSAWRISDGNRIVASSNSADSKSLEELPALLIGQKLLSIDIRGSFHDLGLLFESGLSLHTFSDSDTYENWQVVGGPDKMIIAGPGASWTMF